ncbi:MAG TPA: four helix bundle protein [Phycisphaerales bacterium]|nr:four helix bundle protein [Phycisphaerales bacterium]
MAGAHPPDIVRRTFDFAVQIVKLAARLESHSRTARLLTSQFLNAGTSIGANLEEGQAAESRADFVHKYRIALKEAREARYWLRLFKAAGVADQEIWDGLIDEADQISRVIAQIIVNTQKSAKARHTD